MLFHRSGKPADGQARLVDKGKGKVLFRTVWALPGGGWGLKAANPEYGPVVVKVEGIRLWPAVGRWRMLSRRRPR